MINVQQRLWNKEEGWRKPIGDLPGEPQLVFVFGSRLLVAEPSLYEQLRQFYKDAYILIGSTAGNIFGGEVSDDSITVSALHFEKTKIWYAETTVENAFDSQNVGKKLAEFLPQEDLVHSFVLSDGLLVNGTELAASINQYLPKNVTVTGGLSGDGNDFNETLVGVNKAPEVQHVALIGFYGKDLRIGYAAHGGWHPTKNTYTITKAKGNVLYELNGERALDVYKRLLGDKVKELPGSALLFPLQLELPDEGTVTRTILGVDESEGSMTFAGDIPEGLVTQIMNSTEADLIESAGQAGREAAIASGTQFALLVSCVGRRLLLKDRSREEVAKVREALGEKVPTHGFYSYGELCPGKDSGKRCLLHNQTMTVTTFAEI